MRLEAHVALLQVGVGCSDIGWIGDDEIKLLLSQRTEPVALDEGHARAEPCRIGHGHPQRLAGTIECNHLGCVHLQRQGHCQRAAARTHVEHARTTAPGKMAECELDQQLGVRTGNQYGRRDHELAPVKLALPDKIGHRLARAAPLDECAVRRPVLLGNPLLGEGDETGGCALQHMAQKHTRIHQVDPGARPSKGACDIDLILTGLGIGVHHSSTIAASRLAWCSSVSASTSSSNSPCITASSL